MLVKFHAYNYQRRCFERVSVRLENIVAIEWDLDTMHDVNSNYAGEPMCGIRTTFGQRFGVLGGIAEEIERLLTGGAGGRFICKEIPIPKPLKKPDASA